MGPATVIAADNNKQVLKWKQGFLLCSSSMLLSRSVCTFSSLPTFSIFVILSLCCFTTGPPFPHPTLHSPSLFQTLLPCLPVHPLPLWFSPTSTCESRKLLGLCPTPACSCMDAATASIQKGGVGRSWKQQGLCRAMLLCCWGRAGTVSPPSSGDNSCEHMARWMGQVWQEPSYINLVWSPTEQLHIQYHCSRFLLQATKAQGLRGQKQAFRDWTGGGIIWWHLLSSAAPQDLLLASENEMCHQAPVV